MRKLGASGYISGMAWPLYILMGQLVAAWPIKMSSGHAHTPEFEPDAPNLSMQQEQGAEVTWG